MLMQEAEVRSSAGQHVRSRSSKNMAVSASAFERNLGAFDHKSALRLCQGSVLARKCVMGVRSGAKCSHADA
jgi:hypothetical protein